MRWVLVLLLIQLNRNCVLIVETNVEQAKPGDFTLVTALCDIGREKWNHFTRNYTTYLTYMTQVLQMDVNMVVFIEHKGIPFIREERKTKLDKTKIIPASLADTALYTHLDSMRSVMASDTFKTNHPLLLHPEGFSPEYNLFTNSKPYFVNFVTELNPFNSSYFVWLDAGYGHGNPDIYPDEGTLWEPNNIMKTNFDQVTYISFVDNIYENCFCVKPFKSKHVCINGGFFGGSRQAIQTYYKLHSRIFRANVFRGIVDDDQSLAMLCALEARGLFHFVKGDWYNAFKLFK